MKKLEIKQMEQAILKLAKTGLTKTEVAQKLGITIQTVSKYYKKHNIKLDGRGGQNRIVNHNPFKVRTKRADYWIGMLFADGWITSSKYNIGLKQGGKNTDHMYLYSKFVGKPYYDYNDGKKSVVFGNKETHTWLKSIGIVERKSLIVRSKIGLNRYIVLGYFDGDGTVSVSKKGYLRVGFTSGSRVFLEDLQEYLNSNDIESVLFDESDTIYRLYFNGNNRIKLFNFLYDGAIIFMKRKKDLFQSWINRAELKSREFGGSPEEDNTEQSLVGDNLVRVTHSSESQ
jgi:hypothetical protein